MSPGAERGRERRGDPGRARLVAHRLRHQNSPSCGGASDGLRLLGRCDGAARPAGVAGAAPAPARRDPQPSSGASDGTSATAYGSSTGSRRASCSPIVIGRAWPCDVDSGGAAGRERAAVPARRARPPSPAAARRPAPRGTAGTPRSRPPSASGRRADGTSRASSRPPPRRRRRPRPAPRAPRRRARARPARPGTTAPRRSAAPWRRAGQSPAIGPPPPCGEPAALAARDAVRERGPSRRSSVAAAAAAAAAAGPRRGCAAGGRPACRRRRACAGTWRAASAGRSTCTRGRPRPSSRSGRAPRTGCRRSRTDTRRRAWRKDSTASRRGLHPSRGVPQHHEHRARRTRPCRTCHP